MSNRNRKGDGDIFVLFLLVIIMLLACYYGSVKADKMAGRPFLGDRVVTKDFDGIVMKNYIMLRDDGKFKYQIRRQDGSMTDIFWSEITEVIKGTER